MALEKTKQLAELMTARTLILQRLSSGYYKDLRVLYEGIADTVEQTINRAKPLTEFGKQRLNQQIKELHEAIRITAPDLVDLAEIEAGYTVKALAKVGVDAALPTVSPCTSVAVDIAPNALTVGKAASTPTLANALTV